MSQNRLWAITGIPAVTLKPQYGLTAMAPPRYNIVFGDAEKVKLHMFGMKNVEMKIPSGGKGNTFSYIFERFFPSEIGEVYLVPDGYKPYLLDEEVPYYEVGLAPITKKPICVGVVPHEKYGWFEFRVDMTTARTKALQVVQPTRKVRQLTQVSGPPWITGVFFTRKFEEEKYDREIYSAEIKVPFGSNGKERFIYRLMRTPQGVLRTERSEASAWNDQLRCMSRNCFEVITPDHWLYDFKLGVASEDSRARYPRWLCGIGEYGPLSKELEEELKMMASLQYLDMGAWDKREHWPKDARKNIQYPD